MSHVPYELLVRWNHTTGAIQGAHVKMYDNVKEKEVDVASVAVAGNDGFPLKDVLSAITSGAIIAMDEAKAETVAQKTKHDAEITADKASHEAALKTVQAQLAAAKAAHAIALAAKNVVEPEYLADPA